MPEQAAYQYRVRPMAILDIPTVMTLERLCFATPWPESAYVNDLSDNNGITHYLVCEKLELPSMVVAYGGYWHIEDEAHISTLAVNPDYRRLGLGEFVLASLILDAVEREVNMSLLEVRIGNLAAQALYRKYGFSVIGKRRRYYRDNNEDALVMAVDHIRSSEYQAVFTALWQSLLARLGRPHDQAINTDAG